MLNTLRNHSAGSYVSPPMTIDQGVEEGVVIKYLDHLRMRGLRPWTVYNRRRALARLRCWAGEPILYLDEAHLLDWQRQRSCELQPEPLRTDMSHHRQFYRWAVREGFRNDDPTVRIDLPRVSRHVPRPISDRALANALAAADVDMAAILSLAAFEGFRACEIAGLDWSEVGTRHDSNPVLRIAEGKGGHARIVPLSGPMTAALEQLPHRRGPVIRRLDGKAGRNASHRISQRANDYLHTMGITDTLHQCRHRFGTTMYRACRDIRAVQEAMGHASPVTTAIYTLAASDVTVAAVEAAGLLA